MCINIYVDIYIYTYIYICVCIIIIIIVIIMYYILSAIQKKDSLTGKNSKNLGHHGYLILGIYSKY